MAALIDTLQAVVAVEAMGNADHLGPFAGASGGKLGPASGPAAFENGPAAAAGHAFKEAVFAGAGAFFWLVGPFWHAGNYSVVTSVCKVVPVRLAGFVVLTMVCR